MIHSDMIQAIHDAIQSARSIICGNFQKCAVSESAYRKCKGEALDILDAIAKQVDNLTESLNAAPLPTVTHDGITHPVSLHVPEGKLTTSDPPGAPYVTVTSIGDPGPTGTSSVTSTNVKYDPSGSTKVNIGPTQDISAEKPKIIWANETEKNREK